VLAVKQAMYFKIDLTVADGTLAKNNNIEFMMKSCILNNQV